MQFYQNQLFHIYNQGNNQRQIFFTDDHYRFFWWKMKGYLLPFGDFVSWCLMPNHFHWQFFVRNTEIRKNILWCHLDKVEYQRRLEKYGTDALAVNRKHGNSSDAAQLVTLNAAIGFLLKGYTRAINKELNWTGSLFRQSCKAKDGWIDQFVTSEMPGNSDSQFIPGTDYAFHLMQYIHSNPVKGKIVAHATDYQWSSAREYAGIASDILCDLELGHNIINYI